MTKGANDWRAQVATFREVALQPPEPVKDTRKLGVPGFSLMREEPVLQLSVLHRQSFTSGESRNALALVNWQVVVTHAQTQDR